jgi:type II secretory pathway pseudopilin PulG
VTCENKRHRGFLMTELIVSMTVLGVIITAFAFSLTGFGRFNHHQLIRQRCISAGQATLDSTAITGKPISAQDIERLWPGVTVSIQETDGTGQWQGMKLLQVTTSANSFNRKVEVRLCRYVLENAVRQAGPASKVQ